MLVLMKMESPHRPREEDGVRCGSDARRFQRRRRQITQPHLQ